MGRALAVMQLCGVAALPAQAPQPAMPLPEQPRPDFHRSEWLNLNGTWAFRLDPADAGLTAGWQRSGPPDAGRIIVPFSWASPASGVADTSYIGWYARDIRVPQAWQGRRVFLVIGASDWRTTAWLDGHELGTHDGGYTPFEFELTPLVGSAAGDTHRLVIRVDDAPRPFKLEGKQGYGNARGIWQTVYLEARGTPPLRWLHFFPEPGRAVPGGKGEPHVHVDARLLEPAPRRLVLTLTFDDAPLPPVTWPIPRGADSVAFDVAVPDPHLWTLDDPFLYTVSASVTAQGPAPASFAPDSVASYFGMRSLSVVTLPGGTNRYVALNGRPIYLQLALDQAFHPTGFYTFPSDSFVRDEILRAKQIGLNGLREHVKVEAPRKLYWADRLGLLIMADVPNSWGEPDLAMRHEVESTLSGMIARDENHPAIFAWVTFNEAWGLTTREGKREVYLPETRRWVTSIYHLAKTLDPTRLVDDNSPCCGRGHTVTDLNSWHQYLPGYAWDDYLRVASDSTYPGSPWNFEPGYRQDSQPDINAEFGNVWGYKGSTGDVDWSWDYHRAVNAFRRHPRIAGWLYTELHDVINEWNGYYRFDRSKKVTGLGALVDGMTLRDLHAPLYVVVGDSLSRTVVPGERVAVPLYASFLTGSTAYGDSLRLVAELYGWNALGERETWFHATRGVAYRPWMTQALAPLDVTMPEEPAVAILAVRLEDAAGRVLQRNFCTFAVEATPPASVRLPGGDSARIIRIDPAGFDSARWSLKQWNVLGGLKVDGAGAGFFEYRVPWPARLEPEDIASASFLAEVSAKRLFGKDRGGAGTIQGDFMLGQGTLDPSLNPNAYPMTDQSRFPSAVTVRINGVVAGKRFLSNDPADSRGVLSWHAQGHDGTLHEAGSYGELLSVAVPREALERAAHSGVLVVRLEVDSALPGGLAIYGRHFGRYPLDPTVVLVRLR
jgi:Glycosyl hydrolases family 2, sugar binding domain/Glycosyl hydrolases family 2, TIM barrel domain